MFKDAKDAEAAKLIEEQEKLRAEEEAR